MLDILTGVQWYLILVLIGISLSTNDIKSSPHFCILLFVYQQSFVLLNAFLDCLS